MCEYFLKLDGYYYCNRKNCNIAIIRIRNKSITEKIPVKEIINDKEYLKELHPVDACTLGIIANNERNGFLDKNCIGWRRMVRSRKYNCFTKTPAIIEIIRQYNTLDGIEMVVLKSKHLNKEIEISTIDLCRNQALLYALDSYQAMSIGYGASEVVIRKMSSSHE